MNRKEKLTKLNVINFNKWMKQKKIKMTTLKKLNKNNSCLSN